MQELFIRELENKIGQIVLLQQNNGPKLRVRILSTKPTVFFQSGLRVQYHYIDDPEQEYSITFRNANEINRSRHFYEPRIEDDDPMSEDDDPIRLY